MKIKTIKYWIDPLNPNQYVEKLIKYDNGAFERVILTPYGIVEELNAMKSKLNDLGVSDDQTTKLY